MEKKRPLAITIICILGFILFTLSLLGLITLLTKNQLGQKYALISTVMGLLNLIFVARVKIFILELHYQRLPSQ